MAYCLLQNKDLLYWINEVEEYSLQNAATKFSKIQEKEIILDILQKDMKVKVDQKLAEISKVEKNIRTVKDKIESINNTTMKVDTNVSILTP